MGKTLGRIIAVVTAPITLIDRDLGNITRQIGFAAVGTAVGGPLGAAIGTAIASGIAQISAPPSPAPPAASTSVKTSRPPRVSAYGEMRLYGAYILYETNEDGDAWDGYAVHDGPMESVIDFYLGDDRVKLQSGVIYPGGLVQGMDDGRYDDNTTRIYWTDGRTPGTTIPLAISELPGVWSANHRGDGVCLLYARFASVKSKNFLKRYPSGAPTASIAAKWQKCPDAHAVDPLDESAWTWTENSVRHLLHYKIVRENVDYATKIYPAIDFWKTAQDICDESIVKYRGQAILLEDSDDGDATLVLSNVDGLTNGSTITFPSWGENKTVISVAGNVVTLNSGVERDYATGSSVVWIGGGTEARYRSCVSHQHTQRHAEVISTLLSTFDGWMAPRSDGAFVIYAGKYYTPTVSIGPEHIVSYDWDGVGVDDDEAVNELVCSYISAAHDYNSVECDAWRDEDDIAERGQVLSNNLDIQTPSWGQVRRLAKRQMARTNALYRGTITTNVAGRIARGQRYINLLLREAGTTFYDGPAEITAVTRNMETGGITFSWVAANPNIDAWNPATEEGEPAALGDRVAPQALETPTIDSAVYFESGQNGSRVRITATGPDRSDLTWYARWKVATDSNWVELEYTDTDPGAGVTIETDILPYGSNVEVSVAYQVGDGRVSDWSESVIVRTGSVTVDSTEITMDNTMITMDRT